MPAGSIVVVPATGDRWADVVDLFNAAGNGDLGCWCQSWRRSDGRGRGAEPGVRRERLRREVFDGDPPPGMLAYVDDLPVGWIGFGPRPSLERLVRSRTIPAIDDLPVWSIGCFLIRVGFRRRGVSTALLAAAIEYAREQGAPGLEAYPIDAGASRVDVGFAFVGFAHVFERAGFRRVLETAARSARRPRWLMRLEF